MILTCPECSTSYNVDAAKIPAEGRKVKCASCHHRWLALPESEPVPAEPESPASSQGLMPFTVSEPPPAAETDGEDPDLGADLPKVFRARKADEKKVREAATTGIIWAGMAAVLVVMAAAAAIFRLNVVNAWPKAAAAYAWVGLPVNSLGLTIEGVKAEPALHEGHAALAVSGLFRNLKDQPVTAPPLRISLLNKSGKRLTTQVAQPADAVVPPGETRHFSISIVDPPAAANQLEVAFAPDEARHAGALPKTAPISEGHAPAAPPLRGPEHPVEPAPAPVDAQPLPADSPYALEPHG